MMKGIKWIDWRESHKSIGRQWVLLIKDNMKLAFNHATPTHQSDKIRSDNKK